MTSKTKLDEVRAEFLRRLTLGDGRLLHSIEDHISSRLGKMLRPQLLLAAAATLGDQVLNSRRTLLLAVAVEMLHNASLLHDDVVDRADQRRGQPSVNSLWGNAATVLAGDYLLSQVMAILHEVDDADAARRINRTVQTMVQSELLQLEAAAKPLSADTYLKIIDGKTASLFATACALGNPQYEAFGLHYGRLFQLRDDQADNEATPFTQQLIATEEKTLASLQEKLTI